LFEFCFEFFYAGFEFGDFFSGDVFEEFAEVECFGWYEFLERVCFGEGVGIVGIPFDEVVWCAGKDGAEFVEVMEFECGGFEFDDVVGD
jgi:hypothetical protein